MSSRSVLKRLTLAFVALSLLLISLWGLVSQIVPAAAAPYSLNGKGNGSAWNPQDSQYPLVVQPNSLSSSDCPYIHGEWTCSVTLFNKSQSVLSWTPSSNIGA